MKRPDLFEDETLLGALSDAIDHLDPVSPAARQAAIAACEIGSADAELAALVTESEVGEPVLLREEIDSASLTFRSSRLTIELDIDAAGHVVGLISPPVATSVEVETAAIPGTSGATSSWNTSSDDLGRFRIDVGSGLCRLRIGTGPTTTVTSWFHC